MYVRYVATPRPNTVSTIIVIRSLRGLIAGLALEQLFDRRFERCRFGQRGVFELLRRLACLADQERRRTREAGVFRRLRIRGDRVRERRVVARRRPVREIHTWHLRREGLQVFLRHVFRVLLTLLVVEEL